MRGFIGPASLLYRLPNYHCNLVYKPQFNRDSSPVPVKEIGLNHCCYKQLAYWKSFVAVHLKQFVRNPNHRNVNRIHIWPNNHARYFWNGSFAYGYYWISFNLHKNLLVRISLLNINHFLSCLAEIFLLFCCINVLFILMCKTMLNYFQFSLNIRKQYI